MASNYSYATAISSQKSEQIFSKYYEKDIKDSNNGDYPSNQVNFVTNEVGTEDWSNPREWEAHIPMETVLSSDQNLTGLDLLLTLKNSNMSHINSLIVKHRGVTVVHPTDLSNLLWDFRILTEYVENNPTLNTLNFSKNVGTIRHNSAATRFGIGETMNELYSSDLSVGNNAALCTSLTEQYQNTGFVKRCNMTNLNIGDTDISKYVDVTTVKNAQKSFCVATDARTKKYHWMLIIPLGQFPYFKSCPLMQSSEFDITFTVHTIAMTLTATKVAAIESIGGIASHGVSATLPAAAVVAVDGSREYYTLNCTSSSPSNRFNPLMIGCDSSFGTIADTATINITQTIGSTVFGRRSVLKCKMYKMDEKMQDAYTASFTNPGKPIFYENHKMTFKKDVPGGSQELIQLSSNQSKVTGILLCTLLSKSSNGNVDPLLTPFNPSLNAKHAGWTNFNVIVGGIPLFPKAMNYTYQFFNEHVKSLTVNGGLESYSGSGLISKRDYEEGYGYVYVDLSFMKTDEASYNTSRSWEIDGIINCKSSLSFDVYAFLIYEDSVVIDVSTSEISVQ